MFNSLSEIAPLYFAGICPPNTRVCVCMCVLLLAFGASRFRGNVGRCTKELSQEVSWVIEYIAAVSPNTAAVSMDTACSLFWYHR